VVSALACYSEDQILLITNFVIVKIIMCLRKDEKTKKEDGVGPFN